MTSDDASRIRIDDPAVELTIASSWQTRLAGLTVAAEALTATWDEWPPGLLARVCLTGLDGRSLLEYAQWGSEEAMLAARPAPAMLAGASLEWQTAYRRYRSINASDTTPAPGCIVIVRAAFGTPDVEQRRRTVNALLGGPSSGSNTNTDLLGVHFHISVDGSSILNYAEWASEAAHKAFMEAPAEPQAPRDGGSTPEDEASETNIWAGLTDTSIRRYVIYRIEYAPLL